MNDESMSNQRKSLSMLAESGMVLGLAAIAAIVASAIGYRLGGWHFAVGLQLSEWAAYGGAVALVLSAMGVFQTRPGAARRGFAAALIGVFTALVPVAVAIQWEYAERAYPPINDISTDTVDALGIAITHAHAGASLAALAKATPLGRRQHAQYRRGRAY